MSSIFENKRQWYTDLCEYYNVSPEKALELGTRSPNRMPDLPGSPTTHPVSGMTFEQIWDLNARDSDEDVFQFYRDQGAWSAFRQVIRHKDMTQYHLHLLMQVLQQGSAFCEYGCGVAPYTNSLLEVVDPSVPLTIYLSDVDCEHLTFGHWRAKNTIERRNLQNITLEKVVVTPEELPSYDKKLDTVMIFEVLEHVPSPLATVGNLYEQMNPGAFLCENFIKHESNEGDSPDLYSAFLEREKYYMYLQDNFALLSGNDEKKHPNQTRVWSKK
jgi:hypothetical protein